jgi:hypothetical protein
MERLVKTFSFRVLSSNDSSTAEQRNATDNLIKEIIKLNTEENDNIFILRILRYTRFRLQSLQEKPSSDRAGENVAELLSVIDTELELLKMRMQGHLSALPIKSAKKFHWTGKVTDLVELLYALDTCNCINNGEIGVEELADALSEIFGAEIKNCYNVYMNMKRRKHDSRTYFLDELREKLNKRMVESDLKGGKFKKR